MKPVIRRAAEQDAEVIAILGRSTFRETFGELFVDHASDLSEYLDHTFGVEKIRDSLGQGENTYWLSLVDGFPVGYAKLKFPSPTGLLPQSEVAQLQKIYVLKEFLGRGLGKPLLRAATNHAATLEIDTVWLDVLKENVRAIHFYERHGFETLGEDTYAIGSQTFKFHLMALRGVALGT